jgi:hypothetical protein
MYFISCQQIINQKLGFQLQGQLATLAILAKNAQLVCF